MQEECVKATIPRSSLYRTHRIVVGHVYKSVQYYRVEQGLKQRWSFDLGPGLVFVSF